MPCSSAATSSASRPVTSIEPHAGELAHPGQLAPGVLARVRSPSPRRRPRAAPRSRAPCARCSTRPVGRAPDLVDGARGDHRLDAAVDALAQRVALHHQAGEQRRVAGVGHPQLRVAAGGGRRLDPGVEQLERAHDPAAVGRPDAGGDRRARARPARRAAPPGRARSSCACRRARAAGPAAGAGRGRPARRAGRGRCRRPRAGAARPPARRRSRRAPAARRRRR